ncbi:MAG TPA: hypothetical protein VJR71_11280 [Pseudolabrys sp.]|nr:hypothetical protein [Pseudolabrys sp.]
MQKLDTHEYARQLLDLHGNKAIVVAAKKARSFEEKGDLEEAATWRHIESALKVLSPAHQG